MKVLEKVKSHELIKHETKRHILKRFLLVLIVVILYFIFVSLKFGIKDGFFVTLLTWSFFVFCTPIADAGVLFDFPIRMITGIRMIHAEIGVWIFAGLLNLFATTISPAIYEKTVILKVFKFILFHPFPYWSIIFLSCIGTFLSIYFGDELVDIAEYRHRKKYFKHRGKHELVILLFLIALVIVIYKFLLTQMGIDVLSIL